MFFRSGQKLFGSGLLRSRAMVTPLQHTSRRYISFSSDTEHLRNSKSKLVQDQIKKIDAFDKARGQETFVHGQGTMSGYSASTNQVILPHAAFAKTEQEKKESAPMAAHEFEHALTHLNPNVEVFSQEADEARSFAKQRKVEDELGLPRSFTESPLERARKHSQVRAQSAKTSGESL